jgi:hypothetical protein
MVLVVASKVTLPPCAQSLLLRSASLTHCVGLPTPAKNLQAGGALLPKSALGSIAAFARHSRNARPPASGH